jgi:hypothetical protein
MKLNETQQLLVNAFDRNFLAENIPTTMKHKALSVSSKAFGLEANSMKIKNMFLSLENNVRQNLNIKIGNISFESMTNFKYLEIIVAKENVFIKKIKQIELWKCRLPFGLESFVFQFCVEKHKD